MNFDQLRQFLVFRQFQQAADNLIDNYDFNDIKKAMAHAKEIEPRRKTEGFEDCMSIVQNLFANTIDWLDENSKII